jgi:hypothetical protein
MIKCKEEMPMTVELCPHPEIRLIDPNEKGSVQCPQCWQQWGSVTEFFVSQKQNVSAGLGKKHDQQKDNWALLPLGPLRDVVKVLTKGAEKYSPGNWQKVPDARNRYYSAAMRHLTAWFEGERLDPEWSFPHLAHATCCLLFLAWFDVQERK